ncbi:MAG TPA: hypothetical protein PK447_07725 [Ignavibacteria bacterium]|nr:hypothetical protein [Ignavibacteria bacterium]
MPPPTQVFNKPRVPEYNPGNYQPMNQNNGATSAKPRFDINNVQGYDSLKSLIRILSFLGVIFLILVFGSIIAGISLIGHYKTETIGIILLIGGTIFFSLGSLVIFAARDNIKLKIEQLEVSYKILDSLTKN